MPIQVLLVEDIESVGRSGDVVSVKPGYARNCLLPKKQAVVASKQTLRMQARLQEERAKRAAVDRKEAEEQATKLEGLTLETIVKVDPEGRMYGSVTAVDIVKLFADKGFEFEKRNIVLPHPIKSLGVHSLSLRLKEGVLAAFVLHVNSDIPLPAKSKEQVVAQPSEAPETES